MSLCCGARAVWSSCVLVVCLPVLGCAEPRRPGFDGGGHGDAQSDDASTSHTTADVDGASASDAEPPDGGRVCLPGQQSCSDGLARVCRTDGRGYIEFECDPVQGMACDGNACRGACSPAELGSSYLGCDYFPTVTVNGAWSPFHFGVVVANSSNQPTNVLVTRGATEVARRTVDANDAIVIELPWVTELKGMDVMRNAVPRPPPPSAIVADGAYRLRTDRPVSVYQHSPLEYDLGPVSDECPAREFGSCYSYSADSSLLLPTTAQGRDYPIVTWPSGPYGPSLVAVTASQNATTVTIEPGAGLSILGGSPIGIDGTGTAVLNRGDVLQLIAAGAGVMANGSDFTGSIIHADKPVQVIAGHGCANIPEPVTGSCDHIEESMLPLRALGTEYAVGVFARPPDTLYDRYALRLVRASTRETNVRFEPPLVIQGGRTVSNVVLNDATPWTSIAEITSNARIVADAPILVAQYLQGRITFGGRADMSDPGMAVIPPMHQFRRSYVFASSRTYSINAVNIVVTTGQTVVLDGIPIDAAALVPIPGTTLSIARHLLGPVDVHEAHSDMPFGLVAYGYGIATSYLYAGGMDVGQ